MAEVVARGLRFNVLQMGEGEHAIALVHGLVVDNLSSWYMTLAPALAKAGRAVMYDLRGHGRSDRPAQGYDLDEHVLDLAAVLDAIGLGGKRLTIAGNSAGGLIALLFALRFPERTEALVVIDSHTGGQDIGARLTDIFRAKDGTLNTNGREVMDAWVEQQRMRPQRDRDVADVFKALDLSEKMSNRRNPLMEKMKRLVEETTLVGDLERTPPLDDARLASIDCPTLAIYGQDSAMLSEGKRLARTMPDCTLSVIPGGAHFLLTRETAKVRDVMLAWLAKVRA